MGGEGETVGREGLWLVSLVSLTEVEGVGLLPRSCRDELGKRPPGPGSRKVGRVSGGCRRTLQAGGALAIYPWPSPTCLFVLAGKVANYIVTVTLNRKRNRAFL